MIEGLFTLLKINLIVVLWVLSFFAFLAVVSLSIYFLLHYLYVGEQWMLKRRHH
jgi:hypothetical protein